MNSPSRDISKQMRIKGEAASSGDAAAGSGRPHAALTQAQFTTRLTAASRSLWLIAAAVLGRREGAEDVVQESVIIALQKLNEFQPDTNFGAWMGGIVRNVARNAARKSIRRHTGSSDPVELDQTRAVRVEIAAGPEFDRRGRLPAGQSDFDDRALAALLALDETPRVCLLLRTIRQLPYREIALQLGIPEGTAMSHVHRARQAMRDHMLRYADEGTEGAPRA